MLSRRGLELAIIDGGAVEGVTLITINPGVLRLAPAAKNTTPQFCMSPGPFIPVPIPSLQWAPGCSWAPAASSWQPYLQPPWERGLGAPALPSPASSLLGTDPRCPPSLQVLEVGLSRWGSLHQQGTGAQLHRQVPGRQAQQGGWGRLGTSWTPGASY